MTDFCLCPLCHRSFTLAARYMERQLDEDDALTCPHCLRRFDPYDVKRELRQKRDQAMEVDAMVTRKGE